MNKIILLVSFIVMSTCLISQENEQSFVVYFDYNKHVLNEKSQQKLNAFVKDVKKKKYVINSIETYCDTVGSIEFNKILSDKRLFTINTILSQNKILISKMSSNGEAKNEVINQNTSNSLLRKAVILYSLPPGKKEVKIIQEGIEKGLKSRTADVDKFEEVLLNSKKNDEAIILNIQFMGGTADLLQESEPEVENLYNFLAKNKNVTALIRGHVCCTSNPVIANGRAYKVYKILLDKGIEPERLDFKGYDNTLPIAIPEITEEDRQKNRRVDVIFNRR